MGEVKISKFQLVVMIIGFSYGIVINVSIDINQDVILVYIIVFIISLMIILMHAYLSLLNPGLSLVEICKLHFGKAAGSIIAAAYALFFLFLAVVIFRNSSSFITIAMFPETPLTAVAVILALVLIYTAYQGLEVIARICEILVPVIPVFIFIVTVLLLTYVDIKNWYPFFENGIEPILKNVLLLSGYPIGHLVVFLMIFPHINKNKDLLPAVVIGIFASGYILACPLVRDLLVLGADLFHRSVFPTAVAVRLIPNMNLDPLYLVGLLIGGGIKIVICIYASAAAFVQTFNLKNTKTAVIPLVTLMVFLSIIIFDNLFQVLYFIRKYFFYFSFPFQLLIPLVLLILSLIKKNREISGGNNNV